MNLLDWIAFWLVATNSPLHKWAERRVDRWASDDR